MARYGLIDGYLDTMRTEIRWRRDLDDVVSEMEDHLYSTVEGLLASGTEPQAAQRTTLDRFGEPEVLKAVYASTPTGGIAVPTKNTIRAGTFALVAGGLWLLGSVTYLLMILTDGPDGAGTLNLNWQVFYAVFSAAILAGGVLTVLSMIGMSKRSGGLGFFAMAGLAIVVLGVAASVLAWAVPFWMGVQGVGLVVFGGVALRNGTAPKLPTMLTASGFIIGVITFVVLNVAQVGPTDSYGDYPLAWGIGGAVGMVLVSAGLIGWGRWLRAEEPADIDQTAVPA
jgi:hypothetical protein